MKRYTPRSWRNAIQPSAPCDHMRESPLGAYVLAQDAERLRTALAESEAKREELEAGMQSWQAQAAEWESYCKAAEREAGQWREAAGQATVRAEQAEDRAERAERERDEAVRMQEEWRRFAQPWLDAKGVYHRHEGVDFPSSDACPYCQIQAVVDERDQERAWREDLMRERDEARAEVERLTNDVNVAEMERTEAQTRCRNAQEEVQRLWDDLCRDDASHRLARVRQKIDLWRRLGHIPEEHAVDALAILDGTAGTDEGGERGEGGGE